MLPHGCSVCTSGMEHNSACPYKICIWAVQKINSNKQTLNHYSHHVSRQWACLIWGSLAVSHNQLPLPQLFCLSLNTFILNLTWMAYFLSLLVHKPYDWILWRKEKVVLYIHVAKGLMKWLEQSNHGNVILLSLTEVWMQTQYLSLLSTPVDPFSSESLLNRVILTFFVWSAQRLYRN